MWMSKYHKKYGELSVIKMWDFVKENDELIKYIPGYSKNQFQIEASNSTLYPHSIHILSKWIAVSQQPS